MTKKKAPALQQAEIDVPAAMEVLSVPVESLNPHPLNARKHNVDVIVESLQAHGQYVPVVVNKPTMTILKGHGTVEAFKKLGWPSIMVVYVEADEAQAAQIVAIDNRSSDLASYDKELLAKLIAAGAKPSRTRKIVTGVEQTDFFGTGFDIDTYETLMAESENLTVAKLEETQAQYADHGVIDPEAEAEKIKKAKAVSAVAKAQGFHEVILMYPVEEYNAFMARVKAMQKFWGIESTSKTILEMLTRTLPPTPEEIEAQFLELQDAIKEQKGNELLTAFQVGVHVRALKAGEPV